MITLNDQNFDKETQIGTVIIDFTAEFCGPCKTIIPILNELSEEFKDIKFINIDIEKSSEVTTKFNIRSVPTLILLKDGKEIRRLVGSRGKSALQEWIKQP
jgi:thioredoxin 1